MKVKVLQRNVYYKVAKIEIEIPDSVDEDMIDEYLMKHEELWAEKLEATMRTTYRYKHGLGMNSGDWTDKDQPCEYRYESNKIGGHL